MKIFLSLLILLFCTPGFAQNNDELFIEDSVSLYMRDIISTHRNERDLCVKFAARDKMEMEGFGEIYYTLQDAAMNFSVIMFSELVKGKWSEPQAVSFSGMFSDLEPFVTPDGKWMYFASDRPLPDGTKQGYDIWRVKREGKKWGTPENVGNKVNTTANEFYPSVNNNGDIYFTAERTNSIGKEDIFVSRNSAEGLTAAIPLDTGVNSKLYEFNAWISPDDSLIIFTSYGRKDDLGRGDLYLAKKGKNGKWLSAVHLPEGINSNRLDYCPYMDSNGYLYFTSERVIPWHYRPVIHTLADWDNMVNKPSQGRSDIYRATNYYFREKKRMLLGEEE